MAVSPCLSSTTSAIDFLITSHSLFRNHEYRRWRLFHAPMCVLLHLWEIYTASSRCLWCMHCCRAKITSRSEKISQNGQILFEKGEDGNLEDQAYSRWSSCCYHRIHGAGARLGGSSGFSCGFTSVEKPRWPCHPRYGSL